MPLNLAAVSQPGSVPSKGYVDAVTLEVSGTLHVLVYSSGAYPARPAGLAGGMVRYIGPTQPTTWLAGDEWINNS